MDFVCMGERVVGITQGRGVGGGASGSWNRGLWLMHGSRMLDVHGLGHLVQDVEPGQVGRRRWEVEATARDVELLWWISRFRFVSADLVAVRFGISVQRSRARLRRLEALGLLGSWRSHVSEHKAVWITRKGCALLGQPRRRPPQPTVARDHEDTIVMTVAGLERRIDEHGGEM